MTPGGALIRTLSTGRPAGAPGADFVAACLSPSGAWAHCLTEGGAVITFDVAAGNVAATLPGAVEGAAGGGAAGQGEGKAAAATAAAADGRATIPIGLAHHPSRNLVATYGTDGLLKLWVPAGV
jgi:WD40 repeat-containing protein SMU1